MSNADYGQGEQTLSKAAQKVQSARADFTKLSKDLEGKIEGMRHLWVGSGGSSFQKLQTQWTEKQTTIVSALDTFEASLTSTEKLNLTTDDTQSAGMSKIQGRLG